MGTHGRYNFGMVGLAVGVAGLIVFVVISFLAWRVWWTRRKYSYHVTRNGPLKNQPTPEGVYDVVIVGGGPSGSTAAYYLATCMNEKYKSGPNFSRKVLVLERKSFPREKYCGDAWCHQALEILDEMNVLERIQADGKCRAVERGGFVSPFGYTCIGGPYGSHTTIRTFSIKRYICDEYIAKRAVEVGAELLEETQVEDCKFDQGSKTWEITCQGTEKKFRGRVLIIADGSTSYMARKLGYVTDQSQAFCSHQYISGETHQFDADGVMYFNSSVLPGYSALFKHYNGDMYLGTYILPGGKATSRVIPGFESDLIQSHPDVSKAFGNAYRWAVTPKTAPIRIGGIEKSYGDHLLIVGDAAGQVDPLTGEGIHTAMRAAKIAAQVILEMFDEGDFSQKSTAVYHTRWMLDFGEDFLWSSVGAKLIYHFPILLDAACVVGQRQGQKFLDEFGFIMTGVKPKSAFLQPGLSIPITFELFRQIFIQYILRKSPRIPPSIGKEALEKLDKQNRKTK